jgi:hypothetical protein
MLYALFVFIASYSLLYFCGYAIKVFILNESLKKYDLYITPWIGLGVIVLSLTLLSHLGFSVSDCAFYVLLCVALINIGVIFWKKERIYCDKKEILLIFGVAFVMIGQFGFANAVNLYDSEFTNIYGNNDFASYLDIAKYFLTESICTPAQEGLSMQAHAIYSTTVQTRNGVFFIDFFAYLFHQELFRCVYLVTVFVSLMNTLTFRLFLGNKFRPVFLLLCLLSFNGLYLWLLENGFVGQMFSIGLTVIILFLCHHVSLVNRRELKISIFIGALLILQSYIYMESLPWSVFCVFFLGVWFVFDKQSNKKGIMINIAIITSIFCVFGFNNIISIFKVFFRLNAAQPGWNMPLGSLFDVVGFLKFREFAFPTLSVGVAAVNVFVIALLVVRVKQEKYNSYLPVVLYGNAVLYILFYLLYQDQYIGSYKIFKALVSLSPIVLILCMRFFDECFGKKTTNELSAQLKKTGLRIVCVCALLGLIGIEFGYMLAKPFSGVMDEGHLELNGFAETESAETDYFIDLNEIWDCLYAPVLLPIRKTHVMVKSTYGLIADASTHHKEGDIFIADSVRPSIYMPGGETVLRNRRFTLIRLDDTSILPNGFSGLAEAVSKFGSGASAYTAKAVIDDTVTFKFLSNAATKTDFFFTPENPNGITVPIRIDVFVNGKKADDYIIYDPVREIEVKNISITSGENEIAIVFAEGTPNDLYMRNLYFNVPPYFITSESYFIQNPKRIHISDLRNRLYSWVDLFLDQTIEILPSSPNSAVFLSDGWHGQEVEFRWTDQKAGIVFYADDRYPVALTLEAGTYGHSGDTRILVNGELVDVVRPNGVCEVIIPKEVLSADDRQELVFENTAPVSPLAMGESQDSRILGISVNRIELRVAK